MNSYSGDEYVNIKKWAAEKIQEGFSWEDLRYLCVSQAEAETEFDRLQNDELLIPQDMEYHEWVQFIDLLRNSYTPITELYGISNGTSNSLPVPTDSGSAWVRYKNHLLGKYTGKRKMSDLAVDTLESNCHWMLNHLKRDTRITGAVKGLVMGSVQSGKTANMIGLVTMAAHYDWNLFIVLSGTIDNLRKQTRDRFHDDLTQSGGVSWHVLDYTRNADYMIDIDNQKQYLSDDLQMNMFQDNNSTGMWLHRYAIVCLKNSTRLRNLIKWLHSNSARAARMRIVVIDDEADQASINTVKMKEGVDEEEIERTAVNQLIIDLVKGNDDEGNPSNAPFQAMNYISFTATPYANVLNEAYEDSLYPKSFICSLPESKEYFGAKAIWGSKKDEKYNGLNIIRTIPPEEMNELKKLHKGGAFTLPAEFQKAIAWFLCAAAILRRRGHKKSISMLIHATAIQNGHFEEYDVLKDWLIQENRSGKLIRLCEDVYNAEKDEFRLADLQEGYQEYAALASVDDSFPDFAQIQTEIVLLLSEIVNIELGEEKSLIYHTDAIHLCVDNCRANKFAEDGTYLRIVYPDSEILKAMEKAPVFIVLGGNTLARGLTLEGLVCTYFARNVNQADTLMQMARWFGYRHGYELLQRIWMPTLVQQKFELIEEVDEKLKAEFEDYMVKGKSPAEFGPRVMNSAKIARFMLTSKNKSQNMEACDFDFSGDSYETTKFENVASSLSANIEITEKFLAAIGTPTISDAVDGSYVWTGVPSEIVLTEFLDKYTLFDCSSLSVDIPIFKNWLTQVNAENRLKKWNVVVAGDKKSDTRWKTASFDVGKIERSRKTKDAFIDIGSLRSGRDILGDVCVAALDESKKQLFTQGKKSGKNLIQLRYALDLGDVPLLLLYCIDKDKGKESKYRAPIQSDYDVIGFSIVIAGQEQSSDYVKTVHVKRPD